MGLLMVVIQPMASYGHVCVSVLMAGQ